MSLIEQHIEVIIFTSTAPVSAEFISEMLSQIHSNTITADQVINYIRNIRNRYHESNMIFDIYEIAGGFQLLTKKTFDPVISHVQSNLNKKKLSTASLETLSVVVYKQPVTKAVIESIRGVNSDYALQKLLEKGLIKIIGRSEDAGRPLLYAAGDAFLEHFGLNNLNDLPKLKEFEPPAETIGNPITEEE
ncbi:MAG: SMC-Scp complex subunit ScpB [Saprospiraceae bacterium]|nr:SMC-Scp complex subunit ScpB [Saprospiraceae bacterium]